MVLELAMSSCLCCVSAFCGGRSALSWRMCRFDTNVSIHTISGPGMQRLSPIFQTEGIVSLRGPLTVELAREQYDAAMQNPDCFERAGFAVEDFGEGCLRVREVPAVLEDVPAEDLLCELCERLLQRGGMDEEAIYDELYHSVACKAAIKGNIPSMEQEQQELLRLLKEDPTVRNCPHGRPVAVVITRRELERMFGRIV